MVRPKRIPSGATVHTKPSLAMDSAVPLMYPPPTVVARKCIVNKDTCSNS